jgi:hypothetical protein
MNQNYKHEYVYIYLYSTQEGIPAKILREKRKEIRKIESKIWANEESEIERALALKYKKVRFVERVKVERALKAARNELKVRILLKYVLLLVCPLHSYIYVIYLHIYDFIWNVYCICFYVLI